MGLCVSPSTPVELEKWEKLGSEVPNREVLIPYKPQEMLHRHHPPHPNSCRVVSALALWNWPSLNTKCQRNFSMGYSRWHKVDSESFQAHPRAPQSPSFATQAKTKPFYLLFPLFILLPHIPVYILFSFCWAVLSSGSLKTTFL